MSEDEVSITVDTTRFDRELAKVNAGLIELGAQRLTCYCAYRTRVGSDAPAVRVYRCEVCTAGLGPDYAADGDAGRQQ